MNTTEFENAVIAALLIDNSHLPRLELVASDFAQETCAQAFTVIGDLIAARIPADVLTVSGQLRGQTGRDWLPLLGQLIENCVISNPVAYAKLIRQAAQERAAATIANDLLHGLRVGQENAVDAAIRGLMGISGARKNHECDIHGAVRGAVDEIEAAREAQGALRGLTSGLIDLDECLGGFHDSDLIIVGARTGIGKTAIMLNFADAAGEPVGVISAEQGREQLALRLISRNAKISVHTMRTGAMKEDDYTRLIPGTARLLERKIWINDQPAPTIEDVVRQARKWRFEYRIRALYIDYIQRIRGDQKLPLREQVRTIVMMLKELARELTIPVIALSQVNRRVEARENKRPSLSDLVESGSIEQEADQILLAYRDEVYDPQTKTPGVLELHVAKNRHGPTGNIDCAWIGKFMTIADLAQGWE